MKKILIINNNPHIEIGGIETYSKKIINLFLENDHQVFEFASINKNDISKLSKMPNYHFVFNKFCNKQNNKNKNFLLKTLQIFLLTFKKNIFIKKIIKVNNIDIIIQNTYSLPRLKFLKNKKYIWVQHLNWEAYYGVSFFKWVKKIFKIKGNFSFPNIVCFSKNDFDFLKKSKLVSQKTNIVSITPGICNFDHINNLINIELQNKNKIAFIGRLESIDKNILFLNEITKQAEINKQEIKIHVYGEGSKKEFLEKNKNLVIHNSFDNKNIKEILKDTKVLILVSKREGFGLVIAEALSHGVPCIIANTYLNASFLIDDSRGKLMNNFDPQAWVDAINEIMNLNNDDYKKLSNNCLQFAKENLSLKQFNEKWLKLIED